MRRRQLAAELRRLRRKSDLSLDAVVERLGERWDKSKLSRIENRKIGISTRDLRRLLDLYGVTDEAHREHLTEMARRATERGWWQSYGSGLIPSEYATLIGAEEEATRIRIYQAELVPGLLQTPDYAHAVIRTGRPTDTEDEIAQRVEIRLERQEILVRTNPPPPNVMVVLSEAVLRRQVGSPETMRAQLKHLVSDRERANITVQILPFTAGEHPALVGPFTLINFADPEDLGIVNIETLVSALALENSHEIRAYEDAWTSVLARAQSPADSRNMITTYALR